MRTEKQRLYLNTGIEQIKKFCGCIRLPNALIAFTLKTMSFWSLYGMAFYGWLNKYTTHTSFIGIIAFYILVLFFPTRKTHNVISSFCVCFSFLFFSLVIINGNICVSLRLWIILLIICVATLRIINTKKENKNIFVRDSDCLNKKCDDYGNAKTIAISASMIMLSIWFFYPYLFLFVFDSDIVGNPYENLESLFAGAALVASGTAVYLQTKQIKDERNKFKEEFRFSQRKKIDSNLIDFLRKYETLRNEYGKDIIDSTYEKLFNLYCDIELRWAEKDYDINIQSIICDIRFFYNHTNENFSFFAPFKIFANNVDISALEECEKKRYYDLFVDCLTKKDKAIILTYILCCEESFRETQFYKEREESLYLLFDSEQGSVKTTSTFLKVIKYILGYFYSPNDVGLDKLYDYISNEKECYAKQNEETTRLVVSVINTLNIE